MHHTPRFPPEWPAAAPSSDEEAAYIAAVEATAKASSVLPQLRHAINDLYFALFECEQDERSHGPNPKKNLATLEHRFRLIATGADAIQLYRLACDAVDREPTAKNQRSLAANKKRFFAVFERFDNSFNSSPTAH